MNWKKTILYFLTIFLLILPSATFAAHSVILKSGKTIKGLVTGQNEKGLTIKLPDGTSQTIEKSRILKVVYKDVSEEEEKKIRLEEEKKLAEKTRKEEELKKKKEEEEAKKLAAEEEKRLKEEEKKRLAEEEARKKAEQEALNKEEQNRLAWERAKIRSEKEGTRSVWDVMWRSALVPGWGLWYADRPISGSIYGGLFYSSLLYAVSLRGQVNSAKSAYDNNSLFYQVARPDPANFLTATGFNAGGYFVTDNIFKDFVGNSRDNYRAKVNQYNGALGVVALVYIVQLTHSFIAGSDWVVEEFYSPVADGIQMESRWEATGVSWEMRSDVNYTWRF
jgi:hypothetical protein